MAKQSCGKHKQRHTLPWNHKYFRLMVLLSLLVILKTVYACDMTFESTSLAKSKNGSFSAPVFLNPEKVIQQCTFTFIARENERVKLEFENFDLEGTPPECFHEHLDLFTEIKNPNVESLIKTPFGGRYCGKIPPRPRISLYKMLSFVFLTDRENITLSRFNGTFSFIPDTTYKLGAVDKNHGLHLEGRDPICNFVIDSSSPSSGLFGGNFGGRRGSKEGRIMTPTYPGTYPKNLLCSYKFVGEKNQRIRLEFRDFDLFYGGAHCPFDYMTIYDGEDNFAEKIGTYCGQLRNLVIFSTNNMLFVTFTTLKRTAPVQNRGFSGLYEFSEDFVRLDFIQPDAEHILGSQCDQKILSKKESSGVVFSPNYPLPYQPHVVCRYFIYGMKDHQNLERVRLTFDRFTVPRGRRCDDPPCQCDEGYLKVYMRGQEEQHHYGEYDYEFCGTDLPEEVETPGPRLVLLFNSGNKPAQGFKAKFTFETEYLIPVGTPEPDGSCKFTYRSVSRKMGRFNSPRHPANYPSSTNCTYIFLSTPQEQVQIVFDNFKVRTEKLATSNNSLGAWKAYGREQCVEDWVEIYQIYRDMKEELVGRYCSASSPGPVVSLADVAVGLKVFLHTDSKDVYSGFLGKYMFFPAKSTEKKDCGSNITGELNGIIHSPNFPEKYASSAQDNMTQQCHWFIHVRPGHKVLLYFEEFEVEGKPEDRGCPAATLRVWPWTHERTPLELCGDSLEEHSQILSESNLMQASFYIANKSVGAKGFKATWTEVKDGKGQQCPADTFKCKYSEFCISKQLQCNGMHNCGRDEHGNLDQSDEQSCVKESEMNEYVVIGLGLGVISIVMIAVFLLCHRKRKRRRLEHPMLPSHAHFHTCESIGERFATSSSINSV